MTPSESYLTPEGAALVKAELAELTGAKREELARRLRDAIRQGDLSENADYIMAKEDQAFLEGRILELTHLLKNAVVVDNGRGEAEVVSVGRRVTVQEDGESPEVFDLVGAKEASPRAGKISNESPIGRALLGKRVGEIAQADTPAGTLVFKILKIE
jgi:transcription elongation factor GreA